MIISAAFLKQNLLHGQSYAEAAQHWRSLASRFAEGSRLHDHRMMVASAYERLAAGGMQNMASGSFTMPTILPPKPRKSAENLARESAEREERARALRDLEDDASQQSTSDEDQREEGDRKASASNQDQNRVAPRPGVYVDRKGNWRAHASQAWKDGGWKMMGTVNDGKGFGALVRSPLGTYLKVTNQGKTVTGLNQRLVIEALLG